MRLPTEKELIVIDLLLGENDETYAWDLVKNSNGQLAQNGIYVILMRMVARGLLSDRLEQRVPGQAGPRRRLYKLTAEGRAAREAYMAAIERYPRGQLARIAATVVLGASLLMTPVSAADHHVSPAESGREVGPNWSTWGSYRDEWSGWDPDEDGVWGDDSFYGSEGVNDFYGSEGVNDFAGSQRIDKSVRIGEGSNEWNVGSEWDRGGQWYDIAYYTAFSPDGGIAGYIAPNGPGQPNAAAEGPMLKAVADLLPVRSHQVSVLLLIAAIVGLGILWRELVAHFRWAFRYGSGTFAEEKHIAQEKGYSPLAGALLGFMKAIAIGIVGASPFGGASATRFKK